MWNRTANKRNNMCVSFTCSFSKTLIIRLRLYIAHNNFKIFENFKLNSHFMSIGYFKLFDLKLFNFNVSLQVYN